MATASLLGMPLELLVSISSYLRTPDLASLRLTSKFIERSLYAWFSQEFFTKKQFMLTQPSLQALIDISKHASLSSKLEHVIIATNIYSESKIHFKDEEAATKYVLGFESQKTLLSTGVDREMLTEAFANLRCLKTVGIRDFNARNRTRDEGSWNSWGSTTVFRETGVELWFYDVVSFMPETSYRFNSRVFSTLLYALGRAGRTPAHFEVLLRDGGLADIAFYMPEFLLPSVQPVLHSLSTLLLDVDIRAGKFHTHSNGIRADTESGRTLRQFLHYTPNLSHLRLNFHRYSIDHNEMFMKWFGEPASVPVGDKASSSLFFPPPITLPSLQRLDLGQLSISPVVLLSVLIKFVPRLTALTLQAIGLRSTATSRTKYRPSFWADLFYDMRKIPGLALTQLYVRMPQQDDTEVGFVTPRDIPVTNQDGESATAGAAPSGPTEGPYTQMSHIRENEGRVPMREFLQEMAETVVVCWPLDSMHVDSERDEEDEEDEEVEEDEEDEEDEEVYDEDGEEDEADEAYDDEASEANEANE